MPTTYFVFYHAFLKAAVGDEEWKQLARASTTEGGMVKMSSPLNEAFALILLKNNYFAWLLDAKETVGDFLTDYDTEEAIDGKTSLVEKLLCGIFFKLEGSLKEEGYLVQPGSVGGEESLNYKEVKEVYGLKLNSLRALVRDSTQYETMMSSGAEILTNSDGQEDKGRSQKRRKIMKSLKCYTVQRPGEKAFRGWSARAYNDMAVIADSIGKEDLKYSMFDTAYRHTFASQNRHVVCKRNEGDKVVVEDALYEALFDFPTTVQV